MRSSHPLKRPSFSLSTTYITHSPSSITYILTISKMSQVSEEPKGPWVKLVSFKELVKLQDPEQPNPLNSGLPYSESYRETVGKTRSTLPVCARLPEIGAAMIQSQVIIVVAGTGTGKTSQIPQYCLHCLMANGFSGKVYVTQPKKMACSGCGRRLQVEVDNKDRVGYVHRGARMMPKDRDQAKIVVITDGLLVAMLRNNPSIPDADVIIIDEVHELSRNIEFLLGKMKPVLRARPDLRLVLMSATCDADAICRHFVDFSPVRIDIAGKTKRLDRVTLGEGEKEYSYEVMAYHLIRKFLIDPEITRGDCLVFLPGIGEISQIHDFCLRNLGEDEPEIFAKCELLRLARDLPLDEQALVTTDRFHADGSLLRKVIFATNVAETSITLPNVRLVATAGKSKMSHYDPAIMSTDLISVPCSRHQITQQLGRAGRTSDGVGICFFTETEYQMLPEFSPRALLHADLTPMIPQIIHGGIKLKDFEWFTQPEPEQLVTALSRLADAGIIHNQPDTVDVELTEMGKVAVELDLDSDMVSLFFYARPVEGVSPTYAYDLLVLIAILSAGSSLYTAKLEDDGGQAATIRSRYTLPESEHLSLLNLWFAWRHARSIGHDVNFCAEYGLVRNLCIEIEQHVKDLLLKYNKLYDVRLSETHQNRMTLQQLQECLVKCLWYHLVVLPNPSPKTSDPVKPAWRCIRTSASGLVGKDLHVERRTHFDREKPLYMVYSSLRGDRLSPTEKKLYMQIVTVIPAKVVEERFPKDKNTWLPVPSKSTYYLTLLFNPF